MGDTWHILVQRALGCSSWDASVEELSRLWSSASFPKSGEYRIPDSSNLSKWRSQKGPPDKPYKNTKLAVLAAIKLKLTHEGSEEVSVAALERLAELWGISHNDFDEQGNDLSVIDELFGTPITLMNDNNGEVVERLSSEHSLVGDYISIRYGFHSGQEDKPVVCEHVSFSKSPKTVVYEHKFRSAGGQEMNFAGQVIKFGAQLLCLGVSSQGQDSGRVRVGAMMLRDEGAPNETLSRLRWGLFFSDTPDATVQNPACSRILLRKVDALTQSLQAGLYSMSEVAKVFPELTRAEVESLISNDIVNHPAKMGLAEDGTASSTPDRVLKVAQTISNEVAFKLKE